ncbi:prepilin peptidase [Paenactinomyces guangxiensis]|uniref:Prepilin peptidase n=1 Tax=Paenactinomyces guangxiensis TaxID=1490290 RepID=A0A7W1WUA4_9BACL|nr:A24 family peptidase [Paenactinomyces guangxiensis]MBA4496147.1 prepilin peptidase [Paenactinomyces guangxiensis]MBH8593235.1 prepilin peptidase [Paenactinomyces guangxiensis]
MFNWETGLLVAVSVIVARWLPPIARWSLARRADPSDFKGWLCDRCDGLSLSSRKINRCSRCRRRLSVLQTGVQAVAGLAAMPVVMQRGATVEAWIHLLLIWLLILLSLTDLWTGLIPNCFTYTGIIVFFLFRIAFHPQPFTKYLLAFLVALGGLLFVGWVTEGLGGGDAKLLAMSAWVIGWPHVLVAFWLASFTACLYIGWKALRGQALGWKQALPLGPHLAVGVYIACLWGDHLLDWYLTWLVPF